jgi:hypothetical protein
MEFLDRVWLLLQRNFQVILSVFWISWWITVALCLVLVTISRCLARLRVAGVPRGQTGQAIYRGDQQELVGARPGELYS